MTKDKALTTILNYIILRRKEIFKMSMSVEQRTRLNEMALLLDVVRNLIDKE